jgi:hypothetical protein
MSEKQPAEPEGAPPPDRPPASIKPVKKKVAEDSENLRRREEWFQRRSGGSVKRPAK